MVDGESVRAVAEKCGGYAQCLSSRGMGKNFVSRFTGTPVTLDQTLALGPDFTGLPPIFRNEYYASDEMHADARDTLLPVIKQVLKVDG